MVKKITFLIALFVLSLSSVAIAALPAVSGTVLLHLDANSITSVSNGDPLTDWVPSIGPANVTMTAIDGNEPTYLTNQVNGLPAVSFVAANEDWMTLDNLGSPTYLADAYTVIIVGRLTNNAATSYIITGDADQRMRYDATPSPRMYVMDGTEGYSFSDTTEYHIHTWVGSDDMYLDGEPAGEPNDPGPMERLQSLGGKRYLWWDIPPTGPTNKQTDFDYAEVIVYDTSLSQADRELVEDYLNTKYALVVEESNAPTPDPMTWAVEPNALNAFSISMTATTATDAENPPVEYYFECTTSGDFNSTWQASPSYTAGGLTPDTEYTFQVKARDDAPTKNETGWSDPCSATTLALSSGLPITDGLLLHLDANTISGLSDGEQVATWLATVGPDMVQSDTGKQGIYRTNAENGLPIVDLDGVDDWMKLVDGDGNDTWLSDSSGTLTGDAMTVIVCGKMNHAVVGENNYWITGNANMRLCYRSGWVVVNENANGFPYTDKTNVHVYTWISGTD